MRLIRGTGMHQINREVRPKILKHNAARLLGLALSARPEPTGVDNLVEGVLTMLCVPGETLRRTGADG